MKGTAVVLPIHQIFANFTLIIMLWCGVLGIYYGIRGWRIGGFYWTSLVVAEVGVATQWLAGVVLWILGYRPGQGLHILYGTLLLLGIPAVLVSTRRVPHRDSLIMGICCLIFFGFVIRSFMTGTP